MLRRISNSPVTLPKGPATKEQKILSFPKDFFPDILRRAQNSDGGWGHRPGLQSAVEPTAWSVLALRGHSATESSVLDSACEWLRRVQMADGSWPTTSGKDPGCWTTALASLAMVKVTAPSEPAIAQGVKWLCTSWPAEGNLMWRLRNSWRRDAQSVVSQDISLRGWSWTPNTASWVEPTSYSLILLQNIPEQLLPAEASQRLRLAEKMLYDRACPGGGWNAGNPLVYGVPGVPRIGPTAWALMALRSYKNHSVNMQGLDWLQQSYDHILSPGALALTHLCLSTYGRPVESAEAKLQELYQHSQFLQSIPVVAWASLAVGGVPDWLEGSVQAIGN